MRIRPRAESITAARVLQSFNTWAYKREQPSEPDLLFHSVASAVARHDSINFVLYWGKGLRQAISEAELACLDYLSQMSRRIEAVYSPGAAFTLIMTDTHAAHNGHPKASVLGYFDGVANAASDYGFSTCLLSELVGIADKVHPQSGTREPGPEILASLERCAQKWYRGDGSVTSGAAIYYRMNMSEKRAVELMFPTSIFVTFNGREYREMFPPSLPVFYMYSMRKGNSNKPWFEPCDAQAATTPCKPLHEPAIQLSCISSAR